MTIIFSLIIAYLIGSVSSAIILSKFLNYPDPRTSGSGNAGATNILRSVGRKQALFVLIADALKGVVAIWIGMLLGVHGALLGFVGVFAVIGHIFPVFFKFKGGKGVATGLGAILGLSFWVAIACILAWVVVAVLKRYASLASIVAAIAAPVLMAVVGPRIYAFPAFVIALIIIWKHTDNINRLKAGTENKINL